MKFLVTVALVLCLSACSQRDYVQNDMGWWTFVQYEEYTGDRYQHWRDEHNIDHLIKVTEYNDKPYQPGDHQYWPMFK